MKLNINKYHKWKKILHIFWCVMICNKIAKIMVKNHSNQSEAPGQSSYPTADTETLKPSFCFFLFGTRDETLSGGYGKRSPLHTHYKVHALSHSTPKTKFSGRPIETGCRSSMGMLTLSNH